MHLVRFIDDNEIDVGPLAPCERLRAANLDWLTAVGAEMRRLDDADRRDAFPLKFVNGLVDQGLTRHAERDTLALSERAGDDMCARQRLARAGRHLQHGALVLRRQRLAQSSDGALLVGPQFPEPGHEVGRVHGAALPLTIATVRSFWSLIASFTQSLMPRTCSQSSG
jgi:hypothetical protein